MEVSKEVKETLEGIKKEIIAGKILIAETVDECAWNRANDRTITIIDKYIRGDGLFQTR